MTMIMDNEYDFFHDCFYFIEHTWNVTNIVVYPRYMYTCTHIIYIII